MSIPIIDLFAGPGGLGEGFSSIYDKSGNRSFDIRLSIEKEFNAHKTLELRSFFRKFPKGCVPNEYYEVYRANSVKKRAGLKEELFKKYPDEYNKAKAEAWNAELGSENFPSELIDKKIKKALKDSNNWVLIGGPPCQAYSLVGRSRNQWRDNVDENEPKVHLYKEYLRVIAAHHPSVFVMENVKGLLSSRLNGKKIFHLILKDLQKPGEVFAQYKSPDYKIFSLVKEPFEYVDGQPIYRSDEDYLIKSENYGIPQKRHRIILLGIRKDLCDRIEIIKPLSKKSDQINIKSVIGDLPKIRSALNREYIGNIEKDGKIKRYYRNLKDTPDKWVQLINEFLCEIISINGLNESSKNLSISIPDCGKGSEFLICETPSLDNPLKSWYRDPKIGGISHHESRSYLIDDLKRYLFASIYSVTNERFPRLDEYARYDLLPEHKNALSGKFADRFRVQLPDDPATTITSHISKDGHYFIHYDPRQCRSLTVREAARIQTFPDNYLFCGSRTSQYHQVGNAVPPLLARSIAKIVSNIFG